MGTWQGWQQQLLSEASLPTAEATQEFLFDWSQHTASDCTNNPVDLSRKESGSDNCHKLTSTRTAQNYPTHALAAAAFSGQIHSGNFPHLLAALKAATPYQQPVPSDVANDFRAWGSPAMATYYLNHSNVGSGAGGGGTGSTPTAPKAHGGWRSLRHTLNDVMPQTLRESQRTTAATLRALNRASKVKL